MSVIKIVTYDVTCESCGEAPDLDYLPSDLDRQVCSRGWRIDYGDDGEPESAFCPNCWHDEIVTSAPGLFAFLQYLAVETLVAIRQDIDPCIVSNEDLDARTICVALEFHAKTFLGADERQEFHARTKGLN
jgi:hypothetical protein